VRIAPLLLGFYVASLAVALAWMIGVLLYALGVIDQSFSPEILVGAMTLVLVCKLGGAYLLRSDRRHG
jgi:hypothetical protein